MCTCANCGAKAVVLPRSQFQNNNSNLHNQTQIAAMPNDVRFQALTCRDCTALSDSPFRPRVHVSGAHSGMGSPCHACVQYGCASPSSAYGRRVTSVVWCEVRPCGAFQRRMSECRGRCGVVASAGRSGGAVWCRDGVGSACDSSCVDPRPRCAATHACERG